MIHAPYVTPQHPFEQMRGAEDGKCRDCIHPPADPIHVARTRAKGAAPAAFGDLVRTGGLAGYESVLGAAQAAWDARTRERLALDKLASLDHAFAAYIAEVLACEVCMNPKHDGQKPGVVACYHTTPLADFVPRDKVDSLAASLHASDAENERMRSALERIVENADEVLNPITDGEAEV